MKRMIITLTIVTLLSGTVLAGVYSLLLPRIEENQRLALERSLTALFEDAGLDDSSDLQFSRMAGTGKDAEGSDGPGVPAVYRAEAAGDLLGYAAAVSATGYGGEIQLLAGLGPEAEELTGLAVVSHVETPGLGGRITEEEFRSQFEGLAASRDITYVKGGSADPGANEIEAISGATISTDAVVSGLNRDLDTVRTFLKEAE